MATKFVSPPGEINQAQAGDLDAIIKRISKVSNPGITIGTAASGGRGFAAQYLADKNPPIEELMRVWDFIKKTSGTTFPSASVILPFDASNVKAIHERERMIALMDFDKWVGNKYDPFTNPVASQFLQKYYPEYFKARLEEMNALQELQGQWFNINLMGPHSKEDLYLQYCVEHDPWLQKRLMTVAGAVHQQTESPEYYVGLFNHGRAFWKRRIISVLTPDGLKGVKDMPIPGIHPEYFMRHQNWRDSTFPPSVFEAAVPATEGTE
jgi:hypothetical protein